MSLAKLRALGLKVELKTGRLRISGLNHLTIRQAERALDLARTRKAEIVQTLTVEGISFDQISNWPPDLKDLFEERAGIMEYQGGMSKAEAEDAAFHIIKKTSFKTPSNRAE